MKTFIAFLAISAVAFAACTCAGAQTYPNKPIRIITANSAGGTSDIFVRALGEELQKRLHQAIVIENRSGGGMNIAGRACAEAANDGYTICLLPNETLTLNQFTYKSIPYNPEKDFDPITNAFINTQVMVVSSALNVGSLDELATLSKAKPGALSYSALAIPMQITVENWKKKTGADLVYVPVRGGGDMVTGLLTGTTPVAIVGLPNFIPYIRNGTVKALAVDSDARSPAFRPCGSWGLPIWHRSISPSWRRPAYRSRLSICCTTRFPPSATSRNSASHAWSISGSFRHARALGPIPQGAEGEWGAAHPRIGVPAALTRPIRA